MLIIQADKKMIGEFESLIAIKETKTIMVPRPLVIGRTNNHVQHFIVMDYMHLTTLNNKSSSDLGNKLADLHLHNLFPKRSLVTIKRFLDFLFSICLFMKPKYDDAI